MTTGVVEIPLYSKGVRFSCLIDQEDMPLISTRNWRTDNMRYAISEKQIKGLRKKTYMHRLIMESHHHSIHKMEIDHINHNRLDNRKINLRVCSKTQNTTYDSKAQGCSSIYHGVSFDRVRNKYKCQIWFNKKIVFSKRFETEIEAALQYNEIAKKYHGEYAKFNNIQ